MKTILIGKEGNQPFPITDPMVSRRHAELTIEDDGSMLLRDTNSANGTYVKLKDGSFRKIHECRVIRGMIVRLGPKLEVNVSAFLKTGIEKYTSHSTTPKNDPTPPPMIDITALRYLYDHYNMRKLRLEQQSSTNGLLRMVIPLIASLGAIVSLFVGGNNDDRPSIEIMGVELDITKLLPAVVILVCGGLLFLFIDNQGKRLLQKKHDLEQGFRRNYCCPNCHTSFGTQVYENILLSEKCPKCKCKFYEKV